MMSRTEEKPSLRPDRRSDRCLTIFSKPPRPGYVKTRLIGRISAEQAAELHAAFLSDLLLRLRGGNFDLKIAWALDGDSKIPACEVESFVQEGDDLGERLFNALAKQARRYPTVGAVGSDHPDLPLSLVHRAFDKLNTGADVVLGPALDGGYYLIALRGESLKFELFEGIAWSGPTVLETTLERCERLGLEIEILVPASDVDVPEDLDRLISKLDRNGEIYCPSTRSLLDRWRAAGVVTTGSFDENS